MTTIKRKASVDKCAFCGLREECTDGQMYGIFINQQNMTLHYHCMLFSSALIQRGKNPRHGILGFLVNDVKKELNRGGRLRCVYCKSIGATIGCSVTKCSKKFHLPCGMKNGSMHQFFGRSFCADHRPQQDALVSGRMSLKAERRIVCPICLNSIEPRVSNSTLRTPCCKNTWLHRTCVQKQALNSGYFFKCPLCNNKQDFQVEMMTYGINVPEQDASWERDVDAYSDLLYRHNQCDHPSCQSTKGTKYSKEGSIWQIVLCGLCGSQGCHIACGKLKFSDPNFECEQCHAIVDCLGKTKIPSPKKTIPDDMLNLTGTHALSNLNSQCDARESFAKRIRRCCFTEFKNVGCDEDMNATTGAPQNVTKEDDESSSSSCAIDVKPYVGLLHELEDENEDVDVEAVDDTDSSLDSHSSDELDVSCGQTANSIGAPVMRLLSPTDFPSPITLTLDDDVIIVANETDKSLPTAVIDIDDDEEQMESYVSFTPPPISDFDNFEDAERCDDIQNVSLVKL